MTHDQRRLCARGYQQGYRNTFLLTSPIHVHLPLQELPNQADRFVDGLREVVVDHDGVEAVGVGQLAPGAVETVLREAKSFDPALLRPENLRVPTLVIHGVEDRTVDFDVGLDLMSRIPRAEFCELPGGCHMLALTEADGLAKAIAGFVERIDSEADA